MRDVYERRPDFLIFTGDATALGFEEEFALAAGLLRVGLPDAIPALAVPGNHDYYTRHSARLGLFEKHFEAWQEGERVGGHRYPFARRVGPLYLIAANSCTGNRWFWDAAGSVGTDQLGRLRELLQRPHIQACPRIFVTHYPICRPSGEPLGRHRHLRDLQATLQTVTAGGVSLWLHGHEHEPSYVPRSERTPIPSLGAGSGTQLHRWTYAIYTIEGNHMQVERRRYEAKAGRFEGGDRFEFSVPLLAGP
jgi:3',5'-cyclic AMP phosphodiesterase CpdA